MSAPQWSNKVQPARLSFLALYNPTLGPTDETFQDQVVFWYSRAAQEARNAARKSGRSDAADGDAAREEENEKLRQIGLAQGMVDFARSFSNGEPVDSVETEKSRIVLHELEEGWWILASVDLTRLPAIAHAPAEQTKKSGEQVRANPSVEYSSREVSPPALLIQQLVQAHCIFSLHHGPSLTELFVRLGRAKLCSALDRFWTRFAKTWEVLLHGNPAADVFGGVKLASGGELGIGVGEEEWGSGEREVLEDLSYRTEGLIDLVVSRFGEPATALASREASLPEDELLPWMGSGRQPASADGVVFGGLGAISRSSLRDISLWTRQVYTYGEHAYGVKDNPLRDRRKRRRRNPLEPQKADRRPQIHDRTASQDHAADQAEHTPQLNTMHRPGIPPPIVSAAEIALDKATKNADEDISREDDTEKPSVSTTMGIPDQYMKYLTFGLSELGRSSKAKRPTPASRTSASNGETLQARMARQRRQENKGHFLIGLTGDLEGLPDGEEVDETDGSYHDEGGGPRTVLRTLQVECRPRDEDAMEDNENDLEATMRRDKDEATPSDQGTNSMQRVRVLVYVHRPFIYCFIFANRTSSLQYASFYKELHRTLTPIHKSLLSSTSVAKVAQRIELSHVEPADDTASVMSTTSNKLPHKGGAALSETRPIFDLIYDPRLLTVHTSIPNIPEPGTPAAEGLVTVDKSSQSSVPPGWTRIDALNVHSQVLSTLQSVQRRHNEIERTSKTSRGWWVVCMRVPPSAPPNGSPAAGGRDDISNEEPSSAVTARTEPDMQRVAFLIRKSSNSIPGNKVLSSSTAASGMWSTFALRAAPNADEKAGGVSSGWGPSSLANGMGVDARRYVEGLLSLNR
ncbi:hypothetical protein BAUCODRAFT_575445 [Baudoinia panamericana UAMH 10762]|uniref:CCZ1/INTU/HSP4 first Longin domain-containing protein n=1 Tax=Baudoinia panamericana (strain UAMH 10762) TaxID=717646 RepID=M2NE69_BAUPA|nr:uncharacterized protein BAUCODRAFT_575445 [Baudoinia panamericana UAMH 10762]EMC97504.1 hypothetical protein BAUCODRAFT_575445 [Baudoinia panamericana UAMH 10762]